MDQKQISKQEATTLSLNRKTLVTGFEPFLGEVINPSKLILESLHSRNIENLSCLPLPVSYHQANEKLQQHLQKNNYDKIILLGQAAGRAEVSLERVAINWIESKSADETGFQCEPQAISEVLKLDAKDYDIQSAHFSSFANFESSIELMANEKIPAKVSHSAGAFVCNALYFACLAKIKKLGLSSEVLFVHVPLLPEQCEGKTPPPPFMTFAKQLRAVEILLGL